MPLINNNNTSGSASSSSSRQGARNVTPQNHVENDDDENENLTQNENIIIDSKPRSESSSGRNSSQQINNNNKSKTATDHDHHLSTDDDNDQPKKRMTRRNSAITWQDGTKIHDHALQAGKAHPIITSNNNNNNNNTLIPTIANSTNSSNKSSFTDSPADAGLNLPLADDSLGVHNSAHHHHFVQASQQQQHHQHHGKRRGTMMYHSSNGRVFSPANHNNIVDGIGSIADNSKDSTSGGGRRRMSVESNGSESNNSGRNDQQDPHGKEKRRESVVSSATAKSDHVQEEEEEEDDDDTMIFNGSTDSSNDDDEDEDDVFSDPERQTDDDDDSSQEDSSPATATTRRKHPREEEGHGKSAENQEEVVGTRRRRTTKNRRTRHPLRPRMIIDEDGGTDDERMYDDNNLKNNNPMNQQVEISRSAHFTPTELPLRFIQQQLVDEIRLSNRPTEFWSYVVLCLLFFMFAYSPFFFIFSDPQTTSWSSTMKTYHIVETLRSQLLFDSSTRKRIETFQQFKFWLNETLIPVIWYEKENDDENVEISSSSSSSSSALLERSRYTFLGTMRLRVMNVRNGSCIAALKSTCHATVLNAEQTMDRDKFTTESNPSLPEDLLFSFEPLTSELPSSTTTTTENNGVENRRIRRPPYSPRLLSIRKGLASATSSFIALKGNVASSASAYQFDGGYTTYLPFNVSSSSSSSSSSTTRSKIVETFQKLLDEDVINGESTRFVVLEFFVQVHNSPMTIGIKLYFEILSSGLWIQSATFFPFLKVGGFGGGTDDEQIGPIRNSLAYNVLLFSFMILTSVSLVRFFYEWVRVFRLARFSSPSSSGAGNINGGGTNSSQLRKNMMEDEENDDLYFSSDDDDENENNNNRDGMNEGEQQGTREEELYFLDEEQRRRKLSSNRGGGNNTGNDDDDPNLFSDLNHNADGVENDEDIDDVELTGNAKVLLEELNQEEREKKYGNSSSSQNNNNSTAATHQNNENSNKTASSPPAASSTTPSSSSSSFSSSKLVNQAKIAISYFFQPWNILDLFTLLLCIAICTIRIISMAIVDSQLSDKSSKINQVAFWIPPSSPPFVSSYPDVLDILMTLFTIDRALGGITSVFFILKGMKFLTGKRQSFILSLVFETLSSCKSQLLSLSLLYVALLMAFSLTAHVIFGSRTSLLSEADDPHDQFRTFSSSLFAMFLQSTQLLGGGIAAHSSAGLSDVVSPVSSTSSSSAQKEDVFTIAFFVVFTFSMNFLLVNCFVAVIVPAFSATARSTRQDVGVAPPLTSLFKILIWSKFLRPIIQFFKSPQHSVFRKYYVLKTKEGTSYQKLLVILLKYVKERADFLENKRENNNDEVVNNSRESQYRVSSSSQQQQQAPHKKRSNMMISSTTTTPFEMLSWIPEELLGFLVPLSLPSVVPSSSSMMNYYKFGGASDNPSFNEENDVDRDNNNNNNTNNHEVDTDENKKNKKKKGFFLGDKNILKVNANLWEESDEIISIPLDDYYLQLWMRWASEYDLQIQGERRKELKRLKKNVKNVVKRAL